MLTALDRLTIYSVLCFISFCALVLRTPAEASLMPIFGIAATIIGMLPAPAYYSPIRHPEKAKSISYKHKDKYIFASDTLIFFQNKAIGKPKNKKEAYEILCKLNDDSHIVVSSIVCLESHTTLFSKTKTSLVQTNNMSTDKISKYIDTNYFLDKAGGYGIQNKNFNFVKNFFGCYENILGIPTCLIKECISDINLEKIYNFSSCRRVR